ncbi:MAG: hypothetical protein ACJ8AT_06205 [Hyalangium sp.]|uniref:hypothetical protein n=1 Tax=Hyalangium sp. TaxID=2028555 RepID=UPI003899DBB0
MPSLWRSTFRSTFHYRPFVSVDARGIETWGIAVAAFCRVQPSRRLIRDATGNQVVEEAVLFTEALVTERDLVWLPGEEVPVEADDTSGSHKPLAVHTRTTLLSAVVDHYEVHL